MVSLKIFLSSFLFITMWVPALEVLPAVVQPSDDLTRNVILALVTTVLIPLLNKIVDRIFSKKNKGKTSN